MNLDGPYNPHRFKPYIEAYDFPTNKEYVDLAWRMHTEPPTPGIYAYLLSSTKLETH